MCVTRTGLGMNRVELVLAVALLTNITAPLVGEPELGRPPLSIFWLGNFVSYMPI